MDQGYAAISKGPPHYPRLNGLGILLLKRFVEELPRDQRYRHRDSPPMTSVAKGVPYRFDLYWRTVFLKSRFCSVLGEGHFGREFTNGCFGPVGPADNEEFLRLDSIEGKLQD
jgi:hypothetical protein